MDTDQVKEWMSDNGYAIYADAFAGNSLMDRMDMMDWWSCCPWHLQEIAKNFYEISERTQK